MKIVVIGAGIAGLAYLCNSKEQDVVVYEKLDRIGGLCDTLEQDGFSYDYGPHMSFTNDDDVRRVFDKTQQYITTPIATSYYKGEYVKHPINNNLYWLDVDERCECIESYLDRPLDNEIHTYADWLSHTYGNVMKERFYDVYTRKYWRCESKDLSTTWMGPRFVDADRTTVLRGAMTSENGSGMYMKELRYPKQGGFMEYLKPLIKEDRIILGKEVVSIDLNNKTVYFQDGTKDIYESLVSSAPLKLLPYIIKECPKCVLDAASRLRYTKISMVTVGFNRADVAKFPSVYIYDEDIWAARIHSPSIMSESNAPQGCSSYQFEIYHLDDENPNKDAIIENVYYSLEKMKICKKEDVVFIDYKLVPRAQVVFYNGMEDDRKLILDYLNGNNIKSIGRFGEWDYFWSDQSYISGMNAAWEKI